MDEEKNTTNYAKQKGRILKAKANMAEYHESIRAQASREENLVKGEVVIKKVVENILAKTKIYVAPTGYLIGQLAVEDLQARLTPPEVSELGKITTPWALLRTLAIVHNNQNFPGAGTAKFNCVVAGIVDAAARYGVDVVSTEFGKQLFSERFGLDKDATPAELRKKIESVKYETTPADMEIGRDSVTPRRSRW